MKYYVVSDVHGFYTELMQVLKEKGFFEEKGPRKLIVCGDLYDRGAEAEKLQEFILDLMEKEEVILIRGNHEDLAIQLLNEWHRKSYLEQHHHMNGTIDTVCQLTHSRMRDLYFRPDMVGRKLLQNDYIQKIIPAMRDYYETEHFIYVHGWIPCAVNMTEEGMPQYIFQEDWREKNRNAWEKARWINGMEAAHQGVTEKGKTIICGHFHCSYGHYVYGDSGKEYGEGANFEPYYGEGITAIDACTAHSKKMNCLVIEDNERISE